MSVYGILFSKQKRSDRMQVTYFHHSGFMVETKQHCMIFDYYTQNGKYDFLDIAKYRQDRKSVV